MNVSIGTIARTACLALALTNQILSAAGKPVLPIEDSQLESLVTTGLTVAASLAAWGLPVRRQVNWSPRQPLVGAGTGGLFIFRKEKTL